MNFNLFEKFNSFNNDLISFYCLEQDFGIIPEPIPANKSIPEWFKNIPLTCEDRSRDAFGAFGMTAKKCMPLLDAMSLGFIIPLFGDVNIRTSKDGSLIEASKNPFGSIIEFHSNIQLGGPKNSPTGKAPAIKFINKWIIKTAPGYSTLFIPPLNHIENRFTCLSGLVDTDKYPKEVNFPALWHMNDFDDVIAAGTPLVTCIPIKRSDIAKATSSYKTNKPRLISEKEIKEIEMIRNKQNSRRHVYTNELRESKKCPF